jgi:hypothetical protein
MKSKKKQIETLRHDLKFINVRLANVKSRLQSLESAIKLLSMAVAHEESAKKIKLDAEMEKFDRSLNKSKPRSGVTWTKTTSKNFSKPLWIYSTEEKNDLP